MDADEQILHARICEVLVDAQIDISGLKVEVDRADVTLRGRAPDMATIDRIESIVSRTDGVAEIRNKLVVGT